MKIVDWIIFETSTEKKDFLTILSSEGSENIRIKMVADKFNLSILEAKRFIEIYQKKQNEK